MKEVVILSGKGGTGKTSITGAFAVLAGQQAIIADCDVDAANMHLLLAPDFAERSDFYSGELAVIDSNKCTQCGICAYKCRFGAFSLSNGTYVLDPLSCEGCGYCQITCPEGAISLVPRKAGQVFVSTTKVGSTMVHAKLDIGAENSGKLVAKVKNSAQELAKLKHKEFVIVDGSPGIGCPVVSSLAGASYVVLVTEPTVSGLHDLERIAGVIQKFRIPMGCIINKFDINPEMSTQISHFISSNGIDYLASIPFDPSFTKAMADAKTIVETQSPAKSIIEEVWATLTKKLIN